jgi:hypothetical protein
LKSMNALLVLVWRSKCPNFRSKSISAEVLLAMNSTKRESQNLNIATTAIRCRGVNLTTASNKQLRKNFVIGYGTLLHTWKSQNPSCLQDLIQKFDTTDVQITALVILVLARMCSTSTVARISNVIQKKIISICVFFMLQALKRPNILCCTWKAVQSESDVKSSLINCCQAC